MIDIIDGVRHRVSACAAGAATARRASAGAVLVRSAAARCSHLARWLLAAGRQTSVGVLGLLQWHGATHTPTLSSAPPRLALFICKCLSPPLLGRAGPRVMNSKQVSCACHPNKYLPLATPWAFFGCLCDPPTTSLLPLHSSTHAASFLFPLLSFNANHY